MPTRRPSKPSERLPIKSQAGKVSGRFPTYKDASHLEPKQHVDLVLRSEGLEKKATPADKASLLSKILQRTSASPKALQEIDKEISGIIGAIKARK
ncbi:MAG: hypothetical protein Q7K42_06525 [Candidatus Diapherotrites archaeon]|nr:hypothetical protein [Candidatus Diapherotrites archaeon]